MINPTGKKLEKLLFGIFDNAIEGADRYNHNGSLWLIFTNEMRWVVEYTKSQTLWYNFYFFKNEMEIIGLDCVDNKDLIQKWFESRFLNINPVEDTIQNGVKYTINELGQLVLNVEDTIQNGVKYTNKWIKLNTTCVEDTIQNGVKYIRNCSKTPVKWVEDTIQNGVKHTLEIGLDKEFPVEDTIQNGVKDTINRLAKRKVTVEDTIQNGDKVK